MSGSGVRGLLAIILPVGLLAGADRVRVHELPEERVVEILREHGRLVER